MTAETPSSQTPTIRLQFEHFPTFVAQYTSSLSLGGMFLQTSELYPVGSQIAFDLRLSDGFRLVQGSGEVAWVRPQADSEGRPAGMAIRFQALDEKGRELVLKILEEQVKGGGTPFDVDEIPPGVVSEPGQGGVLPATVPSETAGATAAPSAGPRQQADALEFSTPWESLPEVPAEILEDGVEAAESGAGGAVLEGPTDELSFELESLPTLEPDPGFEMETELDLDDEVELDDVPRQDLDDEDDEPTLVGAVIDDEPPTFVAEAEDSGSDGGESLVDVGPDAESVMDIREPTRQRETVEPVPTAGGALFEDPSPDDPAAGYPSFESGAAVSAPDPEVSFAPTGSEEAGFEPDGPAAMAIPGGSTADFGSTTNDDSLGEPVAPSFAQPVMETAGVDGVHGTETGGDDAGSYGSTPYDSAPHESAPHDSAPHESASVGSAPYESAPYESADPGSYGDGLGETSPHDEGGYDAGSFESAPADPGPYDVGLYDADSFGSTPDPPSPYGAAEGAAVAAAGSGEGAASPFDFEGEQDLASAPPSPLPADGTDLAAENYADYEDDLDTSPAPRRSRGPLLRLVAILILIVAVAVGFLFRDQLSPILGLGGDDGDAEITGLPPSVPADRPSPGTGDEVSQPSVGESPSTASPESAGERTVGTPAPSTAGPAAGDSGVASEPGSAPTGVGEPGGETVVAGSEPTGEEGRPFVASGPSPDAPPARQPVAASVDESSTRTGAAASGPGARRVVDLSWGQTSAGTRIVVRFDAPLSQARLTHDLLSYRPELEQIKIDGILESYYPARSVVGTTAVQEIRVGLHGAPSGGELRIVVEFPEAGPAIRDLTLAGDVLRILVR